MYTASDFPITSVIVFLPSFYISALSEFEEIIRQFTDQTLTGQLTIFKTEGLISSPVKNMARCGGMTLAGRQVPTEASLSLLCSAGQGREYVTKGLRVKVRTGRDHSPIAITGKTDSTQGN